MASGIAALSLLFLFDPAGHAFYPRCWLYATTGWQCPGCGGLRATHSLLHGRVGDAFRFNPLLVTLLPIAAGYLSIRLLRPGNRQPNSRTGIPFWVWVFVGITLAFGVVRNLV